MSQPQIYDDSRKLEAEYDFIVVGGGTAGCTVAGRLAEISPNIKILVIEAGKSSFGVKEISTPALATSLVESEYDWQYKGTLVDRPEFQRVEPAITRGKVLGGSSSLNYYSWHRGSSATYDEWSAYGGPTWSWEGCKKYFSKPATLDLRAGSGSLLPINGDGIGSDGPLRLKPVDPAPLGDALVKAWRSRGLPTIENMFSGQVDGLIHLVSTVAEGVRWNSPVFLKNHGNITVLTQSKVARVVIDESLVARGVEMVGGTTVQAKHEVIVSGGVFESPHVLMLSGIGPPKELEAHGIQCKVASPHVGLHLQEHVIFPQVFHLKEGSSFDPALRPGPLHDAAVREYEQFKTGPLSSPLLEFSAYRRIDDRLRYCKEYVELQGKLHGKDPLGPQGQPHFEYDFVPAFFKPFQPHVPPPQSGDYMTIVTSFMRPLSRGKVTLYSKSPLDQPAINLNFFGEQVDLEAMREAARFVREVVTLGDAMKDVVLEPYPKDLRDLDGDNETAEKLILRRCSTGYHPCGTCRIGPASGELQGVVDERLRVRGVSNLRVVDASVFPIMPDCRIQGPVYMTAEKGSDMIKEDYKNRLVVGS